MSDNATSTSHAFTDLMTSLLVLFVLLLVCTLYKIAQNKESEKIPVPIPIPKPSGAVDVSNEVRNQLQVLGLTLLPVPDDPYSEFIRLDENKVHFETGEPKEGSRKPALDESGANVVNRVSVILADIFCSKNEKIIDSVIIEGHTDKQGDLDLKGKLDNLRLSQRRSYAVMEEIFHYLDKSKPAMLDCFRRLSRSTGRGSVDPAMICQNGRLTEVKTDDENRRVEIKIRFLTKVMGETAEGSSHCNKIAH